MSAESVITIVRSLVISKKPPCLVTDILRDYREIEGGPLPFQKFGYRNAEEFLASSNSFILDRYGGNTYVTAKASADSAHIQSMVRLQKAAKKKPKAAARFPKSNNSNQNWNRTSYSSVYGQNNSNNYRPSNNRPNYNNRQPLRPAGDRNNNNNNGNNNFQNFQKKSQQQNNQQSQSQSQGNKPNMVRSSSNPDSKLVVDNWRNPVVNTNGATKSNSVSGTFSMPEDMRNRLTAANKPPKEKPREEPVKADDLRNKLNAARSVNQEDLRNRLIAKMNNVISNSNSNVPKPQQQQQQVPKTEVQRIQNHHTQEQSKAPIANRLNYMNRIAKANGPAQKQENNLTVIKDYKHYQQKPQKPQPEKPFTFEKSLSPIVQLQEYCIARNLAPPQYQILTYQSRYKCHLVMNNRTYVSDEFGSEMEAKVACSMEAIEEMKAKEAIPLCTDPNYELKIHEKLLQKSGGVFLRGFPQWFETTFQKRIPHNWYQNLQKMPELFTIENSNGDCLIFARVATLSPAVSSSGSSDMEYFASGRISLPFDEKYWNLYITHCKSTVEVWGRIVGMGSSDQFENLMNDIDLHMLTKARRPQSISVGQIYLSSISDCWHRIRVEERKGNMFLCFYIDFGDEEWVDVEKIYVCEPKFLALPPQGIVFSLFGLEDFSGNRCAERILNNKLPNQSLVAEVLTKKEVYEKAFDENCGDYKIQVVLYDTSSNEDVNLNEILVKEICDETPPPVLKSDNSTVNVNVTHIDDKGNLFVQIRNSDWTYVEKLIYELVESKQLKQHKIKKMEISMAGTYLVRSSIHGNFKRAVLHSPPTSENVDTYDMFYVDYGSRANIHISDIYRLESLSAALAKYPSQAIQVKLANLPPITPDLLQRIRTLLPSNTSAIIKVVKNAVIQEVLLYSRMDNGAMYTVNDSILIELDLKQNENGTTSSTNQQPRKSMKTSSPINYVSVEQKLPDLQDYKLPEINEYMDVLVSMSCNPLNFTVLPYDDNESLDKLMKDMKEHYSTTDEYIPVDVIKKGEAYACKHNNFYHRCIVTQVLPKPHFSLFLCDLGEVIVLSNDYLKTLPTKFRELPKQAMKAKLYGIKPKMNDWTLQDCIDFKENTVNKPFVSKIMNISKDNLENDVTVLELHLIDTSTEDDIYMHQTLIDDGIAIPTNL